MAFLHQLISSCFDHFTQFILGGGGCLPAWTPHVWDSPCHAEEASRSPGTGVIDGCEVP